MDNAHSVSVHDLITPFVDAMGVEYVRFYEQRASRAAYVEMLRQTYWIVKETVPSLVAVIRKSTGHPLIAALRENCREERGHDKMLLDDLSQLGERLEGKPSPAVLKYIALARALHSTPDPVSYLYGHIAVLDCYPKTPNEVRALVRLFGVPETAASCYFEHSLVDVKHRNDAERALRHKSIDRTIVIERAIELTRLFTSHWKWMREARWALGAHVKRENSRNK